MRRALLVLCFVTLAPPAAFAQYGLNLFWGDCSPLGFTSATFACNTNTGAPLTMFVSVYPGSELPQFVGVEVTIYSIVNGTTLPSWWQMGTGQCRDGAMTANAEPSSYGLVQCDPIWGAQAPVTAFVVESLPVAWGFRFRFAAAIPEPNPITAELARQELMVGAVRISKVKSTGAGACAGCELGACFMHPQVRLVQPSGVGDLWITYPANSGWVQVNGGNGAYNCYIPARNRTWGEIKALYR